MYLGHIIGIGAILVVLPILIILPYILRYISSKRQKNIEIYHKISSLNFLLGLLGILFIIINTMIAYSIPYLRSSLTDVPGFMAISIYIYIYLSIYIYIYILGLNIGLYYYLFKNDNKNIVLIICSIYFILIMYVIIYLVLASSVIQLIPITLTIILMIFLFYYNNKKGNLLFRDSKKFIKYNIILAIIFWIMQFFSIFFFI